MCERITSNRPARVAAMLVVAGFAAFTAATHGDAVSNIADGAGAAAVAQPADAAKPADAAAKPAEPRTATNVNDARPRSADAAASAAKASKNNRGVMPAFTAEREAAALTFVSAHHPELAPLLAHLKTSRANEYQRVIRKLFVDSEHLAQIREAHPPRYELELKNWQFQSRIQLLVARLTMDRTPELEQELRDTLAAQLQARRELLALDRDRMAARIAGLDKELQRLDEDREQILKDRFDQALNSAGEQKKLFKAARNGAAGKPTASPTTDTAR